MLRRDWGHLVPEKRGYTVYPGFEDGRTEEDCEDVGWMYIDVLSYVETYVNYSEDHNIWYDSYSRPPSMPFGSYYFLGCHETPGFWRK